VTATFQARRGGSERAQDADLVPRPRRLPLVVFALFLLTIAAVAALAAYSMRREARRRGAAELDSIAALKLEELMLWRRARVDDTAFAASYPFVRTVTALASRGALDAARLEHGRAVFQGFAEHHGFDVMALIRADGVVVTEVVRGPQSGWRADPALAERALASFAPQTALTARGGMVRLEVVVPVRPEAGGVPLLVFSRIDMRSYLEAFTARWPGPTTSGGVVLARRDGDAALFITAPPGRPELAWARIPVRNRRRAVVEVVLGPSGVFSGLTDRGRPLLLSTRRVPDSDWVLYTRMELAEVEAPILRPAKVVAALLGAVLAGGGLALVLSWRNQVRQYRILLTAREELSRSEARSRALIEKSTDIILVLDEEGRYRFWSPGATEALGYTAEERLGRVAFDYVHPDDRSRVVEVFRSLLDGDGATAHPVRYQCRRKDGEWRQIEASVRNCLGDAAVRGVIVNGRDVTEQRSLEEQIQQSQKLESVGRLAGGVAHDFNNLLTVILSCAESLQDAVRTGSAASPEELAEIRQAGERARDLTRQLLAFARRQVILPVPLDLNALARNAQKLLRRVLGEDVELETALAPDLWAVRCDPGQVEQVVLNLAVNARDAMPGGGRLVLSTANVEVDERATASNPGMRTGPHVRLTLRDTGHGMPPEVKAHLFEPFFTTKPQGRGTGLGLATVYGIVKQNNGYILVDSAPGHGTAFEIYFPRTLDAPAAASAGAQAASARGSETILIVEDDPKVREVTVRSLRSAGYRVLVAKDGREALAVARGAGDRLDLLVSDVIMPGSHGPAVAESLRGFQPDLRVLYVSGHAQDAIADRGVLARGVELLHKPFTPSTLLARVRMVLDAS
jgi:PAS domain S-box-containing protein